MNVSRSDTNQGQSAASIRSGTIERVENSPGRPLTPTFFIKRIKSSWAGEKGKKKTSDPKSSPSTPRGTTQQKKSKRQSRRERGPKSSPSTSPRDSQQERSDRLSRKERSSLARLPFASPRASPDATVRRILTPNLLSPTTPSTARGARRSKALGVVASPPLEETPKRRSPKSSPSTPRGATQQKKSKRQSRRERGPKSSPNTPLSVSRQERSDRLSRKERSSLTRLPFASPRASPDATVRRILTPNLLSPTTPSTARGERRSKSLVVVASPPLEETPKRRSLQNIKKRKDVAVPSIYRYARKCMWDDFSIILPSSARDIDYVYKKDGTTALHMAVMSRTGYITAFKSSSKEVAMAPLDLIEALLKMDPDVAKTQCTLNGYTPLTYACLVCDSTYDVEGCAAMVRLFLKYCPESIKLFTQDGLSSVDIHVVSYSHHHQEKEEGSGLGKTSASVLRTLLTHSPELANNRLVGDTIKGPMELLYKCNIKAFSQAVMDEIYDGDENGTIRSDFTIPERRQKVLDTVSKWWIWTWTVMILKYGSKNSRQRGAQFSALHAAAMQPSCATPLLSITVYAFPRQIKQSILDKDSLENLPLHAVCSWPSGPKDKNPSQSLLATRKSQAITRVIEEYPLAVKSKNGMGETALELAAKSGTMWDGGIRRLVRAYPRSLRSQSKQTSLYPFMTAAVAASDCESEQREAQSLHTIYALLRSNPNVLTQLTQRR